VFRELKVPNSTEQGAKVHETVGMIARNPSEIKVSQPKHSGFVFVLRDEAQQQVEVAARAVAGDEPGLTGA
jgi:hypothetical protein